MENATKALLIAGSVLVVILLIAMGLRIFNSTNGTTKSAEETMDATEIATFNSQFLSYNRNNVRKSDALTLFNKIISSNSVNTKHQISYSIQNANSGTVTDFITELNGHDMYSISVSDTDNNGFVDKIVFTAK